MPTARLIQVTLGAAATQISATAAPFNQMNVRNNAAAVARLGDSTVSATKGIALAAANAANSEAVIGPFNGMQGDASQYWLFGTAAQLIDVLLT
jgi:hypothetical protein